MSVTDQWNQLVQAIQSKNNEALDLLLSKNGIDVNIRDIRGLTPLHVAAINNNGYAVSKIVGCHGVDVNPQSVTGWTPLHHACSKNHSQIVTELLACPGIQVNVRDWAGWAPIMFSATRCHKEVLQLMLNYSRVDLDVKDVAGRGLEAKVGINCRDEGKKMECLEIINNERMKRKNIRVKQDGSMAGGRGGAVKATDDDSQVDGAQKSENTEEGNPAIPGKWKVDYSSVCWNCSKTEVKLEKCEGCQKAEYCSRQCWEKDWPVHGRWCKKKRCWGCEKTGVKLYKCGGCQKAKYCKRECIEGGWDNHREYCLQQQQARKEGSERSKDCGT